jgi:hypothetical protein
MRSASRAEDNSGLEEDARVYVPNIPQLLKSEGKRSTLRLHAMLSGASRLWQKSRTGSGRANADTPTATAGSKVIAADISRQNGWESSKMSRVMLYEPSGFGGSAKQHLQAHASWMDPHAKLPHVHIQSGAHLVGPGQYNLPPTFPRQGRTPAVFSRLSTPQRPVANQDMVRFFVCVLLGTLGCLN